MGSSKIDEFIAALETIATAEALYDYEADGSTELSIKKGGTCFLHLISTAIFSL